MLVGGGLLAGVSPLPPCLSDALAWLGPTAVYAAEAKSITFGPVESPSASRGSLWQLPVQGDDTTTVHQQPTLLRLPNPYRLIVDIPNSQLGMPETVVPIEKHGLLRLELSETRGTFYNATRVVLYVDSAKTLARVSAAMTPTGLQIGWLRDEPTAASLAPPLPGRPPSLAAEVPATFPADTARIDSVTYQENALVLRASDQKSPLKIKRQWVMQDARGIPNRYVVDVSPAVLTDPAFTRPFRDVEPPFQVVRVGQFEPTTVRIVIDSRTPERFGIVYPEPNASTLAIRGYRGPDAATVPADVGQGQLQNVYIDREGNNVVVRLATTSPMSSRVVKKGDRLWVELDNMAAERGWVRFDHDQFPEVRFLRIEPLTAQQPNSKFVLALSHPDTRYDARLSADGKLLEIFLTPIPGMVGGVPEINQARFEGRAVVVVDAGHGGKDFGAMRGSYVEKTLNLAVALRLKQALEARGIKVMMTRDSDVFLPLPEITRITNTIKPDVFVSVHTNSSTNAAINGLETYYFTPQSIPLARVVHSRLINQIASPDRGVRQARFYVIHHTQVPAILCEMGYISNPSERESLFSEARMQRTANAIADGVVAFLRAQRGN
jgi:N-acetylmuramoyl-L-alanine amidase